MTTDPTAVGRRERGKAEKRARVFDAADRLFREHGYEAVTTQQIAETADVGVGTVFRYFPTKADLFVEVMSAHLLSGSARARRLAASGAGATDAILAVVEPLVAAGRRHPENASAFQREVLFGTRDGAGRGYEAATAPEAAVAEVLARTHPHVDAQRRQDVAHIVYATLYVDLVRAGRPDSPTVSTRALRATLRRHVELALDALPADTG